MEYLKALLYFCYLLKIDREFITLLKISACILRWSPTKESFTKRSLYEHSVRIHLQWSANLGL